MTNLLALGVLNETGRTLMLFLVGDWQLDMMRLQGTGGVPSWIDKSMKQQIKFFYVLSASRK